MVSAYKRYPPGLQATEERHVQVVITGEKDKMVSRYLAADWGSTNLRLWLVEDGIAVKKAASPFGITRMQNQSFPAVLQGMLQQMQIAQSDISRIYIAGMAGSNVGWQQANYLHCPVSLNALGTSLTQVDPGWPAQAGIIPGVCVPGPDGADVMRGEETQLLGALQDTASSLFILPGTHSKWARVQQDVIHSFTTVMTGELFDVLRHHSLLGRGLPAANPDPEAFDNGVMAGLAASDTMTELFSVRARHILGHLPAGQVDDYLSGLLIGSEVRDMRQRFEVSADTAVTLVGSGSLLPRYDRALHLAGITFTTQDADTAILNGIRKIHDSLDT